jgi:uncharacterized protein involved in propanediol utilization
MSTSRAAGRLRLVPQGGGTGYGHCPARHGELLRGAFWPDGPHRPATRALVALPRPDLAATASARLLPGAPAIDAPTPATVLAARAVLAELGVPDGVRVELGGAGAGGAEVVATIRAVAAACARTLPDATLARLAATVDRSGAAAACLPGVVLFAPGEGRVLSRLGAALPPLLAVGVTLGVPTPAAAGPLAPYTPAELDQLGHLCGLLRRAVTAGDARLLGAVATRSAALNQRQVALPFFADLCGVARSSGAVGVQLEQSGTVAGLLYGGSDPRGADRGRAALDRLGVGDTVMFRPQASVELARAVGQ